MILVECKFSYLFFQNKSAGAEEKFKEIAEAYEVFAWISQH